MSRKKITIVGAGMVGSQAAFTCAIKQLGDIVIINRTKDVAIGRALDLAESANTLGFDLSIVGGDDYALSADSDVVVMTAGVPRTPGMSRTDLLKVNADIIRKTIPSIVKYSPSCVLIIVTNPLDAMVYLAKKVSRFPKNRVIGMAGVLDSARMSYFISQELNVSVNDISASVLGGHADTMVPLARYTTVRGIPITDLLPRAKIERIIERTRSGGTEIVNLLKTGSAYYAPGTSVAAMVEAILHDSKKILPCAAYLDGEYGLNDIYMGVPSKLGARGVEQIIQVPLNDIEKKELQTSAQRIRELLKML